MPFYSPDHVADLLFLFAKEPHAIWCVHEDGYAHHPRSTPVIHGPDIALLRHYGYLCYPVTKRVRLTSAGITALRRVLRGRADAAREAPSVEPTKAEIEALFTLSCARAMKMHPTKAMFVRTRAHDLFQIDAATMARLRDLGLVELSRDAYVVSTAGKLWIARERARRAQSRTQAERKLTQAQALLQAMEDLKKRQRDLMHLIERYGPGCAALGTGRYTHPQSAASWGQRSLNKLLDLKMLDTAALARGIVDLSAHGREAIALYDDACRKRREALARIRKI